MYLKSFKNFESVYNKIDIKDIFQEVLDEFNIDCDDFEDEFEDQNESLNHLKRFRDFK